MKFSLKKIFGPKTLPDLSTPPSDYDIYGRQEQAKEKLITAIRMIDTLSKDSALMEREGFSLGGYTAVIATEDGQPSGIPQLNPLTINVSDKKGTPLLVLTLEKDVFKVAGATPAIQKVMDTMPARRDADTVQTVRSTISALTPDSEISASIAYIDNGKLRNNNAPARERIAREAEERRAAAEAAAAQQAMRDIVQDNTVLKEPIKTGAQIKLKPPA